MKHLLLVVLFLCLIVYSCKECVAESIDFEVPSWGIGYNSGHRVPYRGVITTEKEWEHVWGIHATIDPTPPPAPRVDFDKYMIVVNFRGSYLTNGYHIRFFDVYLNRLRGTLRFSYWINNWIPLWLMTQQIFTFPYEMIIVPKELRCQFLFTEVVWNYYFLWPGVF